MVPRALDKVVARLLRKDPGERYQSADAAVADLEQIAAALAQGTADPQVTAGLHDRRVALTEAAFVGRTSELATLTALLGEAGRGRGGLVLLEAESGGGKTRLLDELALEVGPAAWTLRGQGLDQAAQRPFQLLDGVAAGILAAAARDPGEVDRLRRRLEDRGEAVVAALPVLGAALGPTERDELGPEDYGEVRSVEALRALLDALGEPGRPALVLLDDCQWSDGLTARLLARWNERSEGSCHVLVVAAFRSEEVGPGHALRALRARAAITLGPFDPASVGLLCTSMAGALPAEALDVVVHLAEGSPFMASAVLRGMVESGALCWVDDDTVGSFDHGTPRSRDNNSSTAGGWQIDPGPMAAVQTSRRAALFLVRRLELLSPEVLELLGVGAVLGKEFDLGLASELSGRSAADAMVVLEEARHRRILWIDEASGRGSFCHDKLREALLTRLSADERRDLHRRAARRLEETSPDRVFELAYHTTPAARGHGPSITPCGQPRPPVPSTPSRWPPPTTGWLNGGPPQPETAPPGPASPRASATCSCSRVCMPRPSLASRKRSVSIPTGWPVSASRASWRSCLQAGRSSGRPQLAGGGAAPPRPVGSPAHPRVPDGTAVGGRRAGRPHHRPEAAPPPAAREGRRGLPRHPHLQPPGLRLLVPQRQDHLRLGPPAGDEPGRALPPNVGVGPGVLRACSGHHHGALVPAGNGLLAAITGDSSGPRRPVGPGPVPALLWRRPLCRDSLPGVHRHGLDPV